MYSNIPVLLGTVYIPACDSSKDSSKEISTHGNCSGCSLTPEALPPLAAMWTDGQVDWNRNRDRGMGTRTGQRGRDSDIGTGIQGQKAR